MLQKEHASCCLFLFGSSPIAEMARQAGGFATVQVNCIEPRALFRGVAQTAQSSICQLGKRKHRR
jgi:hypothetical protein